MKKHVFCRVLAALMALLMLITAAAMTSCAEQTPGKGDTPATDDGKQPGEEQPGEEQPENPEDPDKEQEPQRLPLELPETNYGGEEVHFLEWTCGGQTDVGFGWIAWEEIDVDDFDGDLLNTAIYDRNAFVEERYGVEITKEYKSVDQDYGSSIRNSCSSGDDYYHVMTMRSLGITSFILEGLMTNMYEMESIHTDKPWWNQDSVASFTLGSTLYFAAPELLLRDKGATATMYYNSQIAQDYGIDDLYDLAKAGDWTWEAFIGYAEQVADSLDGDELMNSMGDRWGLIGSDSDVFRIFGGTGIKYAHIDEDGLIQYDFGSEASILKLQEVFEEIIYSEFFAHNELLPSGKFSTMDEFVNGNGLFIIGGVKDVNKLRNMETNYGILPVPKYDDTQDEYSSLVWVHDDSVLGMPIIRNGAEMVATTLEAMSYYSWYDVYPKFYDTVIMGKSTRDEQSKEMLQIIFRTRLYDPGQYWDSGNGASGIQNKYLRLPKTGESNIASIWASYKGAVEARFEDINALIEESMQ